MKTGIKGKLRNSIILSRLKNPAKLLCWDRGCTFSDLRLYSAIDYLTANNVFNGLKFQRLAERKIKLDNANKVRVQKSKNTC